MITLGRPISKLAILLAHLLNGWACFEHRGLFWLSARWGDGIRHMILVPRHIIAKGKTLSLIRQTGIRVHHQLS